MLSPSLSPPSPPSPPSPSPSPPPPRTASSSQPSPERHPPKRRRPHLTLLDLQTRFFPHEPNIDRTRLRLFESAEANYSITKPVAAKKIDELVCEHLKREGTDSRACTLTDATACVGGDALHFSRSFRQVHAIERDTIHYDMLRHNLEVYHRENVDTHLGDAMKVLQKLAQDVVYFDPPWGGCNYKRCARLRLQLSGQTLVQVVTAVLQKHAPRVVLKLPRNADMRGLRKLAHTWRCASPKPTRGLPITSTRKSASRGAVKKSSLAQKLPDGANVTGPQAARCVQVCATSSTLRRGRRRTTNASGPARDIEPRPSRPIPPNTSGGLPCEQLSLSDRVCMYKEHRVQNFLLVYVSRMPAVRSS